LFAGIGGLRKPFEEAGGKCVFTSEYNKYAVETYTANYETDHKIAGDISKVDAKVIPSHDLLLAGFPCQPFSIAGVSKKNSLGRAHGFHCKTQGTLFFDVARIIEEHKPAGFLRQNVKNIRSHDKGKTFQTIIETLKDELGYEVHYRVLDAKGFVPQHRERIFIVGFREPTTFNFDELELPSEDLGPKIGDILHIREEDAKPENKRFLNEDGSVIDKYTLSEKLWDYLQAYAEKHRKKGNGFGYGLVYEHSVARTLSARYYKDGSEILVNQEGKRPRRLTPRECARLMGFDQLGESKFKIPVSDTQAYKQFGNAVVVPVVRAVAEHMNDHLMRIVSREKDLSSKLEACG